MRIHRSSRFGLTILELTGSLMDVQVKILTKTGQREGRVMVRSFIRQIRPWLQCFDEVPSLKSGIEVGKFGFELRMQRLKLGFSQGQFAEMLGVGRAHLSDIERGVYQPGPRTRTKIKELLGLIEVG